MDEVPEKEMNTKEYNDVKQYFGREKLIEYYEQQKQEKEYDDFFNRGKINEILTDEEGRNATRRPA